LGEKAAQINWVVHFQAPLRRTPTRAKYLARYTHRVATSNHQLRSLENGRVTFDWKNYAHQVTKYLRKGIMLWVGRYMPVGTMS
jgi:hypothetical protein